LSRQAVLSRHTALAKRTAVFVFATILISTAIGEIDRLPPLSRGQPSNPLFVYVIAFREVENHVALALDHTVVHLLYKR